MTKTGRESETKMKCSSDNEGVKVEVENLGNVEDFIYATPAVSGNVQP